MRRGFTLIEILVAIMLTGILTTLALAPVAVTVRHVIETQNNYGDISALSRTLNFIARDLSNSVRLVQNSLIIIDHEALGGKADDILIFMSNSPASQNMPAATMVYKIQEGGIMNAVAISGLYRWICAGKTPDEIDHEKLNVKDAQLILPDVDSFSVEIPSSGGFKDDNKKEYKGALPAGLYLKISRVHEDDNGVKKEDELENVIVFP